MLDLHCHILPGVDDGAASLDESLAMARFCVADGITHVVATPHCHRHCRLLRADILPHVARLNAELAARGRAPGVCPGRRCRSRTPPRTAASSRPGCTATWATARRSPCWSSIGSPSSTRPTRPSWSGGSADRGTTPIIAHPERHGFFADDPDGCGAGRGRGVAPGDGRFAAGQPRPGPAGVRRSVAAGLPGRGAGDRRPQPAALFRAVGRIYLGRERLGRGAGRASCRGQIKCSLLLLALLNGTLPMANAISGFTLSARIDQLAWNERPEPTTSGRINVRRDHDSIYD